MKLSSLILENKEFKAPRLGYKFNDLEPFIDAETMKEHFTKHFKGYVNKLNDALKGKRSVDGDILKVLKDIKKYDDKVRNNAGGVFNHELYFTLITPDGSKTPKGELKEDIIKTFQSIDKFKEEFTQASLSRFGSGWSWLTLTSTGLKIHSTPNQDNPLMSYSEVKGIPIIGMDVWEHAYYLKHRSKRGDYIKDFFKVLNWDKAEEIYKQAKEA